MCQKSPNTQSWEVRKITCFFPARPSTVKGAVPQNMYTLKSSYIGHKNSLNIVDFQRFLKNICRVGFTRRIILVSVLVSASVERCFVTRMRDFLLRCSFFCQELICENLAYKYNPKNLPNIVQLIFFFFILNKKSPNIYIYIYINF